MTRGVVTGWVRPEGDPAERRYAFRLEAPGSILAPSDTGEQPIVADQAGLAGSVSFSTKLVTLDSFVIGSGEEVLRAAGTIGFGDENAATALAASISPMRISSFKQMWIPLISPGSRRWVAQHIHGGRLAEGKFAAALPTRYLFSRERPHLSDDQMRLDLRLEDVSFSTFGELPEIVHASGNAAKSLFTTGGVYNDDLNPLSHLTGTLQNLGGLSILAGTGGNGGTKDALYISSASSMAGFRAL